MTQAQHYGRQARAEVRALTEDIVRRSDARKQLVAEFMAGASTSELALRWRVGAKDVERAIRIEWLRSLSRGGS